jgi:hypothetical protein
MIKSKRRKRETVEEIDLKEKLACVLHKDDKSRRRRRGGKEGRRRGTRAD